MTTKQAGIGSALGMQLVKRVPFGAAGWLYGDWANKNFGGEDAAKPGPSTLNKALSAATWAAAGPAAGRALRGAPRLMKDVTGKIVSIPAGPIRNMLNSTAYAGLMGGIPAYHAALGSGGPMRLQSMKDMVNAGARIWYDSKYNPEEFAANVLSRSVKQPAVQEQINKAKAMGADVMKDIGKNLVGGTAFGIGGAALGYGLGSMLSRTPKVPKAQTPEELDRYYRDREAAERNKALMAAFMGTAAGGAYVYRDQLAGLGKKWKDMLAAKFGKKAQAVQDPRRKKKQQSSWLPYLLGGGALAGLGGLGYYGYRKGWFNPQTAGAAASAPAQPSQPSTPADMTPQQQGAAVADMLQQSDPEQYKTIVDAAGQMSVTPQQLITAQMVNPDLVTRQIERFSNPQMMLPETPGQMAMQGLGNFLMRNQSSSPLENLAARVPGMNSPVGQFLTSVFNPATIGPTAIMASPFLHGGAVTKGFNALSKLPHVGRAFGVAGQVVRAPFRVANYMAGAATPGAGRLVNLAARGVSTGSKILPRMGAVGRLVGSALGGVSTGSKILPRIGAVARLASPTARLATTAGAKVLGAYALPVSMGLELADMYGNKGGYRKAIQELADINADPNRGYWGKAWENMGRPIATLHNTATEGAGAIKDWYNAGKSMWKNRNNDEEIAAIRAAQAAKAARQAALAQR